jgi:hypothetical protein
MNTRSKGKGTLHEGAERKAALILHLSGIILPFLPNISPITNKRGPKKNFIGLQTADTDLFKK